MVCGRLLQKSGLEMIDLDGVSEYTDYYFNEVRCMAQFNVIC